MRLNHTILQVIPELDAGGAERTTLEVAAAVGRAGGRALVATAGGRLAAEIQRAGGEIINMPVHSKNPLTIWRNANRLARLIEARGVALIHARSRAPAWSALMAARRTGVPFVTTYHGAYKAGNPVKRYYNSSMLRADCVIANSHFTAETIRATGTVDPRKLRVIPRGANLDLFDPAKVSPARVNHMAQDWGLPVENGCFRLLLPARLTSWKGHEVAIQAVSRLKTRAASGNAPALTLVFCGGAQGRDDYEQSLRAMIEELGVCDMIHLVGDCADMPAAYSWAEAVIAPSTRPEAFGRVAVEAGAMERPVIASNHGGAKETVIDGTSGFLVEPGDADALADAIDRVMAMSAEDRRVMGENGRARAVSVYSAAAMCDATLRAYSDLLDKRA